MELHAPESPIHSLKDFAVHIAVVTCGILIALGLEGVRESLHNRHLIHETRENVHFEMGFDQKHAAEELQRVKLARAQLKSMVDEMPELVQQHPDELRTRLKQVTNPGYFFTSNSWSAALSTGALALMSTKEVSTYAYAAEGIKNYSQLQTEARLQEARAKAFFVAHPHLTPDQVEEGTERLMLFYNAEEDLVFVCPQMKDDIDEALTASQTP
jgi:hypothetical protein